MPTLLAAMAGGYPSAPAAGSSQRLYVAPSPPAPAMSQQHRPIDMTVGDGRPESESRTRRIQPAVARRNYSYSPARTAQQQCFPRRRQPLAARSTCSAATLDGGPECMQTHLSSR
jgi:hypothetical protein